jgi:hypothetical protein
VQRLPAHRGKALGELLVLLAGAVVG